jgi:hypothetical protein
MGICFETLSICDRVSYIRTSGFGKRHAVFWRRCMSANIRHVSFDLGNSKNIVIGFEAVSLYTLNLRYTNFLLIATAMLFPVPM